MFSPNTVYPWWKVNQNLSAVHLASASLTDHFPSHIPNCATLRLIKASENGRLSGPSASSRTAKKQPELMTSWEVGRWKACKVAALFPNASHRFFFVANKLAIQSAARGWQVFMCVPRVMKAHICILSPGCQSLHMGNRRL